MRTPHFDPLNPQRISLRHIAPICHVDIWYTTIIRYHQNISDRCTALADRPYVASYLGSLFLLRATGVAKTRG